MKKIILFIILLITGALLAMAGDGVSPDLGVAADAGFTLLEMILLLTGAPAGGLAILLIRAARQGTKAVLKSLDENPDVDNCKLLKHASGVGDKKAVKLFKKIN